MEKCKICDKRGHFTIVGQSKPSSETIAKTDATEKAIQAKSTKLLWPEGKPKKEKASNIEGMVVTELWYRFLVYENLSVVYITQR